MTLREIGIGKSAVIKSIGGEGALRQHFLDMGLIPGAEATVVKLALYNTCDRAGDSRKASWPKTLVSKQSCISSTLFDT